MNQPRTPSRTALNSRLIKIFAAGQRGQSRNLDETGHDHKKFELKAKRSFYDEGLFGVKSENEYMLQKEILLDVTTETLKRRIDYAAKGRLRKMSVEKDWATIKELAQYEDKGWNDPILPDERSIDHKNPNIEQLLGIMENYVDMLMKDAISIIRRSENVFGISSDMMRQLPPKLSRQEAFKDLVMNFILYQEEKVRQL
ncbi:hypothetical protein Tco_0031471 [Tanacetum coccineum]